MASPSPRQPAFRSFDDFLDWVEVQDRKWQLIDGELVMMAGGSDEHAFIAANAIAELLGRLRGTGCRAQGSDLFVYVDEQTGLLPDVSVICRRENGRSISEPVVVIEVLSPSTERDDRGRKSRLYRRLASLKHYVLLSQDAARAEIYDRTGDVWVLREVEGLDAVLTLPALDVAIPLAALYADVAFTAEAR